MHIIMSYYAIFVLVHQTSDLLLLIPHAFAQLILIFGPYSALTFGYSLYILSMIYGILTTALIMKFICGHYNSMLDYSYVRGLVNLSN